MTKGQGALEYLMTYGWALLVIVVVGAALFALGVLNPQTYTRKNCVGFQYFRWEDHQMTPAQFQLSLQNTAQSVSITNLSVSGDSSAGGDVGALTGFTNPLSPQSRFTMTGTNDPTTKSSGEGYSYTITVTYNVVGGITGQKDFATCTGTVV